MLDTLRAHMVDDHPEEQQELLLTAAQGTSDSLVVPISDIENRMSLISRVLPVSNTALDVFQMTRSETDAAKLAAAIQRDAALAAEVLSIANSSFYNRSGNSITELEQAVVRIGQRRIGELALAAATLAKLTKRKLPWMDMQTIWRQSIAAGVALENLVYQGKHGKLDDSLMLIAIMNSLGRVVLGTFYPNHYRQLIKQCAEGGEALIDLEKTVFPENHARIMTRLLSAWNLPNEICKPMRYICDSYNSLSRLPKPTRTKAELIKLAVFIGELAINSWHSWDLVEIPPASLLERLRIHDMNQIIEHTSEDTQAIIDFRSVTTSETDQEVSPAPMAEATRTVYYYNASTLPFDFIALLIRKIDMDVASLDQHHGPWTSNTFVNAIGAPPKNLKSALERPGTARVLVLTDSANPTDSQRVTELLKMPVSYGKLCSAIVGMATTEATKMKRRGA